MIAFRVFHNDSELCLAGIEGLGVLTAIVTWAKRGGEFTESGHAEESLDLTVGALQTATDESLIWPSQRLSVGETITIKIEESDSITKPTDKLVYPEAFKIEAMKQSARDLAQKLGWQLIETQYRETE